MPGGRVSVTWVKNRGMNSDGSKQLNDIQPTRAEQQRVGVAQAAIVGTAQSGDPR